MSADIVRSEIRGVSREWFREDTEVIDFFALPREEFLLGGKPAYMGEG